LSPAEPKSYLLARKAMLEFKAGNARAGYQWMDQALAAGDDPCAALLALTIEAIRYQLPFELGGVAAEVERRWQTALKKKHRSEAAGLMSARMATQMSSAAEYPGLPEHVERVLAYVRGCSRVRNWRADDLRSVCLFLQAVSEDDRFADPRDLLAKLATRGNKRFPQEAVFPLILGKLEIDKGPIHCNRWFARQCFEQARDAAKTSPRPEETHLVEIAERQLTFLGEVGLEQPSFLPPELDFDFDEEDDAFADVPPRELLETFARMCDSMGLDPEEVMDRAAAGKPLKPPQRRKSSQSKPSKRKR
jgi:hypothetical protein